ncbi:MAG TPA: RNA methyltransferase [Vicinamibacterales bacterium]|nr:RNA methyltransferase [Vicinamibacterales bacterium]
MRRVSSRQNDTVRSFRALAKEPDSSGARLLLDGAHLVHEALATGLRFEIAAVASSRLDDGTEIRQLAETLERRGVDVVVASDAVFDAMSPVRTPSGIVAIVAREPSSAARICQQTGGLTLATVDVQDPGNLGALVRVAEAGGVTGMLVCTAGRSGAAHPFSWRALRGSMGSALRMPLAGGITASEAVDSLHAAGGRVVAAVPRDGRDPDDVDWSGQIGLVVGGEGPGLDEPLLAACDELVTVPMAPQVESLNVAAAGAILIYAARRQRK